MSQLEIESLPDQRPRPEPDGISRFFWDAAAEGRLVMQRCESCERLQYPPEVCCVRCQTTELEHVQLSGRGTLFSYAIVDRLLHIGFADAIPYIVALVELDEQPELRILTNLVDVAPGTPLAGGLPVEVVFEDRGSVTLPQFRLVEPAR